MVFPADELRVPNDNENGTVASDQLEDDLSSASDGPSLPSSASSSIGSSEYASSSPGGTIISSIPPGATRSNYNSSINYDDNDDDEDNQTDFMYEYPVFGPFSSSINTAWTDVISAIQDGNLTEAEKSNAFLHQGTYGWTIYHWAVHSNASPDVVAILIEEGSLEAVTKVDEEGVTPLNMACWAVAPFEVIDLFIKAAPEAITTVDKEQFTAIHSAAKRHPSTEVMRALVNAGGRAAVQTLASAQRTTLFLACDEETCILDNIQLLVEVGGTDTVLLADDDGTTPLHELCHRQEPRLDVIRYILETGKQEVVLRSDEEEKLPLHFACQSSSSVELVTLLLESGGSDTIDAPDTGNFTPFMNACKSDGIHSLEIVKLLIDKRGEALNLRNVLHLAIDRAQPQIDLIRLLVDLDATLVYQVDENDSTPLHSACQIGAKEIVLLLVEVGGKQLVLMPDSAGITPLILSLARDVDYSDEDFISIIKCLIDSGGSEGLSKCDDWGNTPLHNACWNTNNSVGIVELIVEKGDKHVVLSQNRRGYTPLLLACMIPQDENVVQYLLDAGGYAAVMQDDDDGRIPLHYLFVHGAPVRMIAEFICIGGEESLLQCDIKGNNPFFYRRVNWMDENFPSARKAKPWDKIFLNEAFITSGLWKCLLGLYIQVLVLIVFSFIIPTFTRPESEGIPYWCSCCLIFILVFQGLASLQQIIGHPLKTILFSIRRVLAFCQFFLICYVAKVSQHQNNLSELGEHLVLVASVVIWLNFVSTLTYLSYDVSVLVRVFWEVFVKLIPFFIILAAILSSLTNAMHINAMMRHDCLSEEVETQYFESFCDINYSYLSAIGLLLNEWSFVELNVSTSNTATVILIASCASLALLILGTLLSWMNTITKEAYEKARAAFWTDREEIVKKSRYIPKDVCKDPMHLSSLYYDIDQFDDVVRWFVHHENDDELDVPPFRSRLKTIRKFATFDDVVFLGKDLETLLMGQRSVRKLLMIRLLIWIMFPFLLFFIVVTFVSGLITLGLLWPRWIKESLFFGPIEVDRCSGKVERITGKTRLTLSKKELAHILSEIKTEDLESQRLERIQFKDEILIGVEKLFHDSND